MPVYNVAIAYTERLTRTNTVLVRADTNEEAEAFARRGFRRSQEEGPAYAADLGQRPGLSVEVGSVAPRPKDVRRRRDA